MPASMPVRDLSMLPIYAPLCSISNTPGITLAFAGVPLPLQVKLNLGIGLDDH
jgi:hypothetical protein